MWIRFAYLYIMDGEQIMLAIAILGAIAAFAIFLAIQGDNEQYED